MNEYKTKMFEGLETMPEKFMDYAMRDVDDLLRIYSAFIELVNNVQGMVEIKEENRFKSVDIPMTVGSLVAQTIEEYIFTLTDNRELLQYCINKLGKLDRYGKDTNTL